MFKNFCQNAFISLYFIVSTLGGFSAHLDFRSFSPYQSVKIALCLGVTLILLQLPMMFAKLLDVLEIKKGETNEWYQTNEIIFLRFYNSNGAFGFYLPSYWRRDFFNVYYYSHPIFIYICLLFLKNQAKKFIYYHQGFYRKI